MKIFLVLVSFESFFTQNITLESRCSTANSKHCVEIEDPKGSIQIETNAASGTDVNSRENKENPAFHPQVVQLLLRKGERKNITITYTDRKHRPLDLYIVMDLSCSMKKHKDKVASLATSLANRLRNMTNDNLRIGFGSFVDKPLPPLGTLPGLGHNSTCNSNVPAYGFKNHLTLTSNDEEFKDAVSSVNTSLNVDSPEGTLDGLLQSIVCTEKIGWRVDNRTRKLIVISTDGPYHLAGDGKLMGVVLPHDGACYVDSTGKYTHATILDYPSISVIRQRIRENDVFVIFAVTQGQLSNYKKLSEALQPFATTEIIDDGGNSITTVIEKGYRELVDTVTLLSEYKQNFISLKIYVKCPDERDFKGGNQCQEVAQGKNVRYYWYIKLLVNLYVMIMCYPWHLKYNLMRIHVECIKPMVKVTFLHSAVAGINYNIEVELKDCPSSSNPDLWQSNITLFPQSSSKDIVAIKLKMLCGCDCEKSTSQGEVQNESDCSGHGFIQCGICKCDENWGGPTCKCPLGVGVEDDKALQRNCFDPNTRTYCSERGICKCGKCTCDPVDGNPNAYGGKYCECDNTNCALDKKDKGLCNKEAEDGPHGYCQCSHCQCFKGFLGDRCECPESDEKCKDPKSPDKKSNASCNGFGKCDCGKCACEWSYKGDFCEIQHAQLFGSCEQIMKLADDCVNCLVFQTNLGDNSVSDKSKSKKCERDCANKHIEVNFKDKIVGSLRDDEKNNVCQETRQDPAGCRIDFIIREKHIHTNTIILEIESGETVRKEKCPTPAPILEIVIGVAGAMVLIGVMLLLVWKVTVHIQDRKEYARFEKSINEASWNEQNPLYKTTTAEFHNPAYSDLQESEIST